jgi:hypothetical protein
MPAASEVVRQYARYYSFAFNLDIASPVFERAPDLTVVPSRTNGLPRGLTRAATACPDQGAYNDCCQVNPFHRYCISRRSQSVVAESIMI